VAEAARGLRDRKKERTRRELQATALQLFAERGYDEVTVEEIAAACEVSRATVFRYFPTKEDLVVGGEPERLAELRNAFEQRPADEPVFDAIRHALVSLAHRYQDDRDQLLLTQRVVNEHGSLLARRLELQAEWAATFASLIATRTGGGTSPDMRSRILAAAIVSAVQVAVADWLAAGGRTALPDLLGDSIDLLAGGFGA
jgi:AcrR family transcriptional regulator